MVVTAALLLSVGFLLPHVWKAIEVNRWSTAYLAQIMNPGRRAQPLPSAPQAHERAIFWLAQEALSSGKAKLALDMIQPLLEGADPVLLSLQGDALAAMHDFEGAVDVWVQAGDYQSLVKAAEQNVVDEQLENAELAFDGAFRVNPFDGTSPLSNFLWHVRLEPASAEQVLRASLSSYDPNNLNWLRSLGLALQAQLKWDEAIAVYEQALKESPDDVYSLNLIGLAYLNGKNDTAQAQSFFENMILLSPSKGDGYFGMGQLLAKEGKPEEADVRFAQAIDRNPDNPWYWVARANTARDTGKVAFALEIYHAAVERFPENPSLHYEVARAYQLDNDQTLAIKAIEEAQTYIERQSAWYFVRAGEIYEWVGEIARARTAYLNALDVDPGNFAAHQAAEHYLERLDAGGS